MTSSLIGSSRAVRMPTHLRLDHAAGNHQLQEIVGIAGKKLADRHRQRAHELANIGPHHAGAPAMAPAHQALDLQDLHGLAHRARRHTEFSGDFALGRQMFADRAFARQYLRLESAGDRQVQLVTATDIPDCHRPFLLFASAPLDLVRVIVIAFVRVPSIA